MNINQCHVFPVPFIVRPANPHLVPPIRPRTRRRMVHQVLDATHHPPRADTGAPHAQTGSLPRIALAVAEDELRAVAGVGTGGLALMERGDPDLLLVGEVVPIVADVGELRIDELFEDVAVQENVFLLLAGS